MFKIHFFKHNVYKHMKAQILGSKMENPHKKLPIWPKLFLKGSLGHEKHFNHIFRGKGEGKFLKVEFEI